MWLKPNFDAVLPDLVARSQWVLAKAVQRDGKVTKVPHQPNGSPASVSDLNTWSSFDEVRTAYERGEYIGVGFVLDGRPQFDGQYLHGFDWDHCVSDGRVDPKVMAAVNALEISRIELSVSGTGLRGFFLHNQKMTSRKTHIDGRSVELYSAGRYLTTTGLAFRGKELLL